MSFKIQTGANLFCGDHDPGASLHLELDEISLPTLQEKYADWHPGGSVGGTEVPVGIEKLEATFKLGGSNDAVMAQFGLGSRMTHTYTAYGALRDQITGAMSQSRAVIRGRLGKVEPNAFKRGEMHGHDYTINGIIHYELYMGGREIYWWDFVSGEWRVNGESQNGDELRLLNIGI